jgi:hypothetical protein
MTKLATLPALDQGAEILRILNDMRAQLNRIEKRLSSRYVL